MSPFPPTWFDGKVTTAAIKATERCIIAAFTTRNTVPFLLFLIIGVLCWRMPPEDIKDVLKLLIDSRQFAFLGWSLFGLTFTAAWGVIVASEKRHQREMDRIMRVKELALKGQLELPLSDSSQP